MAGLEVGGRMKHSCQSLGRYADAIGHARRRQHYLQQEKAKG